MNECDLFIDAMKLDDEAERAAFLERMCAGDSKLKQRVEALIGANDQAGSFLKQPAPDANATMNAPQVEKIGSQIGRYKLRELLGEGGMGTVFVAEQERPVRRKVALKLIKLGMDSRDVISRFEAERQALALMDHPNIARVLDGGLTPSGRPYFVMELVKGLPITEHCDQHRLGNRQRLELFLQVCRALQHAHQKGIIHRDLKPSNVLVAMHDTIPVVKVIDFGVAKAIGQQLTEKTLYTALGQMVGTPMYMSPEQAGQSSIDVDTRSDVYSLGVLLYELLTGCTPFEKETFKRAAYDEMRRIIREVDPPRPSTRFSSLNAATSSTIATYRQSEPHKLSQQLRGELDWIIMKSLEKERTRRYESASAFAADIEHHLRDEPVAACPPSLRYRIGKTIRRRWSILLPTAVVTIVLVSGTAISLWQALEARYAREQSVHEKTLAQDAGRQAILERDRAREAERRTADEAATVAAVNDFLLKDIIGLADSNMQAIDGISPSPQLTMREALDSAAATVGDRFEEKPRIEARLRKTIGIAYRGVGEPLKAILHLERCVFLCQRELGDNHAETMEAMQALATTLKSVGRSRDAIPMLQRVVDWQEAHPEVDQVKSLISRQNLAETLFDSSREAEGLKMMQELLDRFADVLGPDADETITCESNLAGALYKVKQPLKAISLFEQVVEKSTRINGAEAPNTLTARGSLAAALSDAGRTEEAIKLQEELRPILETVFGPNHPKTLICMNNLASDYGEVGRNEDAISMHQEVVVQRLARLGPEHIETLQGLNNLAVDYMRVKRPLEAIPLYEQSYNGRKRLLGMGHRDTLNALSNLSVAYQNVRRTEDALQLLGEAFEETKTEVGALHNNSKQILQWQVEICERCRLFAKLAVIRRKILEECLSDLEPGHPDRLALLDWLANANDQAGNFDAAATVMKQYVDELQAKVGIDSTELFAAQRKLGGYLRRAGRWTDAEKLYSTLAEQASKTLGPEDRMTLNARSSLGQTLYNDGRISEGVALLEQIVTLQQAKFGPLDPEVKVSLNSLAWGYYYQGHHADAERIASELLTIQRKAEGTEAVTIAHNLSLLGMILFALGKSADAEKTLRESMIIWDTVKQPEWHRFRVINLLGAAIGAQSRPLEAEPLLVDGYKGMAAAKVLIPAPWKPQFVAAGEYVLHFYENQGDSEKATLWRETMASADSPNK